MSNLKKRKLSLSSNVKHPLENIVWDAFDKDPLQDRVKLFSYLRGNSGTIAIDRAYMMVAEDVLEYMFDQGKLDRDKEGWYQVAELPDIEDERNADSVEMFIGEKCVEAKNSRIDFNVIYQAYREYCEANKLESLGRNKFGRRLNDSGHPSFKSAGHVYKMNLELKSNLEI